jgi:hypothetical protein
LYFLLCIATCLFFSCSILEPALLCLPKLSSAIDYGVGADAEEPKSVASKHFEVGNSVTDCIDLGYRGSSSSVLCNSKTDDTGVAHSIRATETEPGPRIKNVCRRAAIVLGEPATFPPAVVSSKLPLEINLSALPERVKQHMFCKRLEGKMCFRT